jgi:hypothetical protein
VGVPLSKVDAMNRRQIRRVHVPSQIQVDKVKDFVRQAPTGEIDIDRSLQIIHEL